MRVDWMHSFAQSVTRILIKHYWTAMEYLFQANLFSDIKCQKLEIFLKKFENCTITPASHKHKHKKFD